MKIALDSEHFLNSDQYCYWITYKGIQTSKKTGEEKEVERRVSGYSRNFSDAVNSYIENKLRTSDAKDLCELKSEIQDLKKTVSEWRKHATL